jgi:hypothetical protein
MKFNSAICLCFSLVLILVGCAGSPTIRDTLQVKSIDTGTGDVAQSTLLGGLGLDRGFRVICDADGACTLFGNTIKSFGESTDYLVIRMDQKKPPLWARTLGGTNKDELQDAIAARDGGYLLFGQSQSLFFTSLKVISPSRIPRPLIVKLDRDGRVEWAKLVQFNDAQAQTAFFGATQMPDGGFVLVGRYGYLKNPTDKEWSPDMFALKLAGDGKPVWMHRYHLDADYGVAVSATLMPDGRVTIIGHYFDDAVDRGFLMMTLSTDGSPMQLTEYPGPMEPYTLALQADGQLVIAGSYTPIGKPESAYILSLDQKGVPKYGHIYSLRNPAGTPSWVGSFALRSAIISAGHIALVGHSGSAGVVRGGEEPGDKALGLVLNEQGNVESEVSVLAPGTQSTHHSNSEFVGIAPLGGDRFALLGSTDGFGASFVNFLYTIWTPHPGASVLFDVSGLDVKATPAALPVVSGDTAPIENVPVSDIDVTEIKVGGQGSQP